MRIALVFGAGLLMCVGSLLPAQAQEQASALPTESVWKAKSHVVRTTTGEEISGRVLALGPDDVRMLVKGQVRTWRLDEVVQVDRKGDSLKNGAIVGAIVLGGWCAFAPCGQAVIFNAGIGALIGMGIDAGNQVRTTVYQKSSPAPNRQARLVVYRFSF